MLAALHRHSNVKDDLGLISLDCSKLTGKGSTIFKFYNAKRKEWVDLTKLNWDFCTSCELQKRFGGPDAMKNFLTIDETPLALERYFKAVTKLKTKLHY